MTYPTISHIGSAQQLNLGQTARPELNTNSAGGAVADLPDSFGEGFKESAIPLREYIKTGVSQHEVPRYEYQGKQKPGNKHYGRNFSRRPTMQELRQNLERERRQAPADRNKKCGDFTPVDQAKCVSKIKETENKIKAAINKALGIEDKYTELASQAGKDIKSVTESDACKTPHLVKYCGLAAGDLPTLNKAIDEFSNVTTSVIEGLNGGESGVEIPCDKINALADVVGHIGSRMQMLAQETPCQDGSGSGPYLPENIELCNRLVDASADLKSFEEYKQDHPACQAVQIAQKTIDEAIAEQDKFISTLQKSSSTTTPSTTSASTGTDTDTTGSTTTKTYSTTSGTVTISTNTETGTTTTSLTTSTGTKTSRTVSSFTGTTISSSVTRTTGTGTTKTVTTNSETGTTTTEVTTPTSKTSTTRSSTGTTLSTSKTTRSYTGTTTSVTTDTKTGTTTTEVTTPTQTSRTKTKSTNTATATYTKTATTKSATGTTLSSTETTTTTKTSRTKTGTRTGTSVSKTTVTKDKLTGTTTTEVTSPTQTTRTKKRSSSTATATYTKTSTTKSATGTTLSSTVSKTTSKTSTTRTGTSLTKTTESTKTDTETGTVTESTESKTATPTSKTSSRVIERSSSTEKDSTGNILSTSTSKTSTTSDSLTDTAGSSTRETTTTYPKSGSPTVRTEISQKLTGPSGSTSHKTQTINNDGKETVVSTDTYINRKTKQATQITTTKDNAGKTTVARDGYDSFDYNWLLIPASILFCLCLIGGGQYIRKSHEETVFEGIVLDNFAPDTHEDPDYATLARAEGEGNYSDIPGSPGTQGGYEHGYSQAGTREPNNPNYAEIPVGGVNNATYGRNLQTGRGGENTYDDVPANRSNSHYRGVAPKPGVGPEPQYVEVTSDPTIVESNLDRLVRDANVGEVTHDLEDLYDALPGSTGDGVYRQIDEPHYMDVTQVEGPLYNIARREVNRHYVIETGV